MTKVNKQKLEAVVSAMRKIKHSNMTAGAWSMGLGCGQDTGITQILWVQF